MTQTPNFTDLEKQDAVARQRISTDLGTSFVVEAAAGTGKTTALIKRLVAVLADGEAEVHEIVAVTFTRKAAGELKLKLRVELEQARSDLDPTSAQYRHVDRSLARLEEATIGTIHSFCAEILHQRPIAAGIDPNFVELDREQADVLHEQVFRRWIQEQLGDPSPALQRTLARLAHAPAWLSEPPLERLRRAALMLLDWRDFDAPWQRPEIDLAVEIDRLTDRTLEIAAMSEGGGQSDPLFRSLAPVRDLADWVLRTESEGARIYPELEARLGAVQRELSGNRWKGRGDHYTHEVLRGDMLAAKHSLTVELDEFAQRSDADLAAALHSELAPLMDAYDHAKRQLGGLDFADLLLQTRDLLTRDQDVRAHLQRQYKYIFVDEFQDTDPIQAAILLLLTADDASVRDWRQVTPEAGKLFLVGDPKQSIYRFRRADVRFYQQIQDYLLARGVERLYLSRSFRSLQSLQQTVNAAFATAMHEDHEAGQAQYVPLLPVRDRDGDADRGSAAQPSVIALPVPRPYGRYSLAKSAVEASLPDTTAAFIQWLVEESGWTIEDPASGKSVAIRPRHICLLFRRFVGWKTDITNGYVRALESRGLPHMLVGGRSLHHREEIETLRTALMAIEWPSDELSVYATLKGSLFALPDEQLFLYREHGGKLDPLAARIDDARFADVASALDVLAAAHRQRNRIRIATTIGNLLRETRAHAGFVLRPAGRQVLANINHLVGVARAWERRDGSSFRGFVEYLVRESESFSTRQPAIIEETDEGVRVMTLHSAKGLEFPVVILADPTTNATKAPSLAVDAEMGLCAQRILGLAPHDLLERQEVEHTRDRAEAVRVAYVAATRARDLLVVPAVGDLDRNGNFFPSQGWLAPLYSAVYPKRERFHLPVVADKCPRFGSSSVLERPVDMDGRDDHSVRPGLHKPQIGNHQVVWWDPAALNLDAPSNFGLVHKNLLAEPQDGDGGRKEYEAWRQRRRSWIESGSRPSRTVIPVSEVDRLPVLPQEALVTPEVQHARQPGERPQGRRFGTLTHSILSQVSLDGEPRRLEAAADFYRRIHQATVGEAAAAMVAVEAALAHPLLEEASKAERLEREYPFLHRLPSGEILDGVIDLFFVARGTVTLIDFKTDLLPGNPIPERYGLQMSWYSEVLRAATDLPVKCVLMAI